MGTLRLLSGGLNVVVRVLSVVVAEDGPIRVHGCLRARRALPPRLLPRLMDRLFPGFAALGTRHVRFGFE